MFFARRLLVGQRIMDLCAFSPVSVRGHVCLLVAIVAHSAIFCSPFIFLVAFCVVSTSY
jgi:hypothetical protein